MRIHFLKRNRPGPMLVGLGVGVAIGIGAMLGIVLAPRSGKDTQTWLVERGKRGAQRVSDKVTGIGTAAKRWTKARVG
jgi:gas vesicle protein